MRILPHNQVIGWHPTDLRLPIALTIRSEDLAAELIREVDAAAHSAAIKPVDWPKIRATAEGLAWAEADSADVEEVEVAGEAAVAAEVVAEAAAADDASWRFVSLPRILRNRNSL